MPEEKSRSSQDYIDLPGSASAGAKPAAGRAAEEKSDIHDAAARCRFFEMRAASHPMAAEMIDRMKKKNSR